MIFRTENLCDNLLFYRLDNNQFHTFYFHTDYTDCATLMCQAK